MSRAPRKVHQIHAGPTAPCSYHLLSDPFHYGQSSIGQGSLSSREICRMSFSIVQDHELVFSLLLGDNARWSAVRSYGRSFEANQASRIARHRRRHSIALTRRPEEAAYATSFTPRYPTELTPSGPQFIPDTSRSAGMTTSRLLRVTRRRAASSGPTSSGPTYVYRCTVCRKLFERKTQDTTLRPHKNLAGWQCHGTDGMYVRTKY